MAKKHKNSLRLDADFTEDTVGLALESFLTLLSFPRSRFSIEPFSKRRERFLGADARLNGSLKKFKPFYMQFKRPSAWPDVSRAGIITDRKALGLPVDPRSLFFNLRNKRDSHFDYQHNILFRLRERLHKKNLGDAAYVCPLFLDRSAYRFHIHMAGLRGWFFVLRHFPWEFEDILINSSSGSINFNAIPVLREHVSIPPHTKVSTASHSYSFTEQGTDLCFHSPMALPQVTISLADFLNRLIGRLESDEGYVSVEEAHLMLRRCFGQNENGDGSLLPFDIQDEQGIESWLYWGDYLKTEYQIEQFALMHWVD